MTFGLTSTRPIGLVILECPQGSVEMRPDLIQRVKDYTGQEGQTPIVRYSVGPNRCQAVGVASPFPSNLILEANGWITVGVFHVHWSKTTE